MATPFDYKGNCDTCTGCAEVIRRGDMVAPVTDERPDRLLCVACWWLVASDLPLPAWAPRHLDP